MTDYFAVLEEPRRPWVEPDALKQRYLLLSAQYHPDRCHGAAPEKKAEAERAERLAEHKAMRRAHAVAVRKFKSERSVSTLADALAKAGI